VGYGRIGSQISVLAEALGMNVVFYDPAPVLPLGNARSRSSLEQVLDEADVVTLHVPASATTAGMIGAAELKRMKPGSYLINNARGSVVDLEALREALTSGHLAGAAIDVYPEEPATRDAEYGSPLQELDNVILTPHIGGSTVEAQRAIAEEASGKLIRLMNDGSTAMSVNLPAVDLPTLHPDHHRIVHIHRNVPGVLGRLHSAVGDAGLNVAASYLQSDAATGYTILDVSRASDAPGDVPESMTGREKALLDALRAVPETIRVRSIW
jgi:D-3-phosphoglycerate dehydrogenase